MLDMKLEKTDESTARLNVGGDLTVVNISSLYGKICDLYKEVDELSVNIQDDTSIDLTFIQLMCASHRAFSQADKKFYVSGNKGCLFSKTDEVGYTRHKGCEFDKHCTCALVKKEV
ncbi:MAG: hypothetical protein C0602_06845 [Denitrovibrio sp.]|mgnify:CR=1 FL=1|nr:MAG: hypothetical protein C0602_06845 [Denitrovibrio sp.]